MKYPLITGCILVLFISSCAMFGEDPPLPPQISGNWSWEQSTGGFSGATIYSDSVDYTQSLEIESNGDASWFRNEKLVQNYVVESDISNEYQNGLYYMVPVDTTDEEPLEEGIILVIENANTREMRLSEECTDCYIHIFSRVDD